MNHEIDYSASLPLSQPWERAAIRELCTIAYSLVHDGFDSRSAFTQRLREFATDFDHLFEDLKPLEGKE